MKIRFEVAARKSWGWPYFLERAKRDGRYSVRAGEKTETHVVEFDSIEACVETWQAIRSWKWTWYYFNDKQIAIADFNFQMWKYTRREISSMFMMQAILEKSAQKREREDGENRWRMGMGPEPDF